MEKFKFLMFILFAFTCQAKAFDYVRLQLLKCNVVDSALVTDIFNSYDEECKKLLYTFGCDGDTSSIVFIEEKGKTYYFIIKRDSVPEIITDEYFEKDLSYVWKSGVVENYTIFSYSDYMKTGVTTDENTLKFTPPMYVTKIVYYEDSMSNFYFEDDISPVSYHPDSKKIKYRTMWLERIHCVIDEILKGKI